MGTQNSNVFPHMPNVHDTRAASVLEAMEDWSFQNECEPTPHAPVKGVTLSGLGHVDSSGNTIFVEDVWCSWFC